MAMTWVKEESLGQSPHSPVATSYVPNTVCFSATDQRNMFSVQSGEEVACRVNKTSISRL